MKRILSVLYLFSLLLLEVSDAAKAQARFGVEFIDAHVHLIAGRGEHKDFEGATIEAIGHMDRLGIRKAIILPPPQVTSQDGYDYPAFVHALSKYPDRFSFLGGGGELNAILHNFNDASSVTAGVKRTFADQAEQTIRDGAIGFGEIASLHISAAPGHPYMFVPADHPLLRILADVAAKFNVPIDLHMDAADSEISIPSRFKDEDNPSILPSTISSLRRLLKHNPDTKVVWAHGGSDPLGSMSPAIIGKLMDEYLNLYVSLRVVGGRAPMHNKLLAFGDIVPEWIDLLNRHSDRFVIGSDSFFVSPNLRGHGPGVRFAQRNVPKLRATKHFLSLLPPSVARKIARDNAVRIYGLK
jgi:predicted TIM-barrel fold metal-dependent hydrolase